MKQIIIILGVLLAGFSLYMIFGLLSSGSDDVINGEVTTFPVTGSGSVTGTGNTPPARMVVNTSEGFIEMNDIRSIPGTREVSAGRFELRPLPDEEFFQPFNIVFADASDSFAISLNEEPIAETRLEMEAFLKNGLGISEAELCTLKVLVGVPVSVNEFISGQNLGFSFCPGSVSLE